MVYWGMQAAGDSVEFSPKALIAAIEKADKAKHEIAARFAGNPTYAAVSNALNSIRAYEKGHRRPTPESMERLARALDVKPEDLCESVGVE